MKFIINNESFDASPLAWPEGSTFRLMYEGDRNADEFRLTNSVLKSDSIKLIIDVVTRNVEKIRLRTDEVNWKELKIVVNYLGIGLSTDYIYPLFLTIEDRKNRYLFESNTTGGLDDLIKIEESDIKTRDSDYTIIIEVPYYHNLRHFLNRNYDKCDSLMKRLSTIPNLFVAGDYALARFSKFRIPWLYIDVFSYGDNSLTSLKRASEMCLTFEDHFDGTQYCPPFPCRYKTMISIPIFNEEVYCRGFRFRFILIKYDSPSHILNSLDIDSSCVGFNMKDPDTFYALPRFIRAYETKTNTVDPTIRGMINIIDHAGRLLIDNHGRGIARAKDIMRRLTSLIDNDKGIISVSDHVRRLISIVCKGFNIAVPGYHYPSVSLSYRMIPSHIGMPMNSRIGLEYLLIASSKRCPVEETYDRHGYSVAEGETYDFVIMDVMNEGQREFVSTDKLNEMVTYIPNYPLIELVSTSDDICYQRTYTFYG